MSDAKPISYVYCITNRINHKFYVGSHCGSDPHYFGSGTGLKRAIKKYGRHNFFKEILHHCADHQMEEERLLLALDAARNPQMYNLITSAHGGTAGLIHTEERKRLMSAKHSGENNPNFGRKRSAACRKKSADAQHRRWAKYRNQQANRQN